MNDNSRSARSLRIIRLGAGVACALSLAPFGSAGAQYPGSFRRVPLRSLLSARPRTTVTPAPCATNYPGASFVGIAGQYDVAGGENAAVLGGYAGVACGSASAVGAGYLNSVSGAGSFIGAGDIGVLNSGHAAGNSIGGIDSFVGAGDDNVVSGSGSFIGAGDTIYESAGGTSAPGNVVAGTDSFLGAGDQNSVGGNQSFLGGGEYDTIASAATAAVLAGGSRNLVGSTYAAILGGYGNSATAPYAVVAGGDRNSAAGTLSFAAGYNADAAHNGSFVWSDYGSGSATLKDTAANQFVIRASGGVYVYSNEAQSSGVRLASGSGTWASLSDRTAKTDIVPIDDVSILERVAALPVSAWRYKSESGVRHVGPMAQDFYAAFGVGEDDRHITPIDEDGVALAAIKALYDENRALRAENLRLEKGERRLDAVLASLLRRRGN
jgi:Chaperone of endosialidase